MAAVGTLYFGSVGGLLYAVKAGSMKWSVPLRNCALSSPTLSHEGTIYLGTNAHQVHAVSSDGRLLWSFTARQGFSSTPAILPDGDVIVGNDDGTIYVLSHENGESVRKVKTNGAVRSSAAIGADGTAYVGSDDGLLYAIAKDGEVRGKDPGEAPGESSPAIAPDGRMEWGSADKRV